MTLLLFKDPEPSSWKSCNRRIGCEPFASAALPQSRSQWSEVGGRNVLTSDFRHPTSMLWERRKGLRLAPKETRGCTWFQFTVELRTYLSIQGSLYRELGSIDLRSLSISPRNSGGVEIPNPPDSQETTAPFLWHLPAARTVSRIPILSTANSTPLEPRSSISSTVCPAARKTVSA